MLSALIVKDFAIVVLPPHNNIHEHNVDPYIDGERIRGGATVKRGQELPNRRMRLYFKNEMTDVGLVRKSLRFSQLVSEAPSTPY